MTPEQTARQIAENVPYEFPEVIDEDALTEMIAIAIQSYGDERAAETRERAAHAAINTSILDKDKGFLTAYETRGAVVVAIAALPLAPARPDDDK